MCVYVRTYVRVDGWVGGWMGDGWMDRWMDVCICLVLGEKASRVDKTPTVAVFISWFLFSATSTLLSVEIDLHAKRSCTKYRLPLSEWFASWH